MIVAWTGHRPDKLGGYDPNPLQTHVRDLIRTWHDHIRPQMVVVGMAQGLDQWAAEDCRAHGIPYVAAIPFVGQDRIWPPEARLHYQTLLAGAALVHVCGVFPKIDTVDRALVVRLMQSRNRWMVDHADLLLGLWDGTNGGTADTVRYALSLHRPVQVIDPHAASFPAYPPLPLPFPEQNQVVTRHGTS